MRQKCRLCNRRTVDDSIFCASHREQAQRFSLSFGKQGDTTESAPTAPETPETNTAPPEPPTADATVTEVPGVTPVPADAEPPEPAPTPETDEERAVLAAVFHAAFDELRSRLTDQPDPERWPQLSLYYLDDTLHCRAYFSVVPRRADELPPPLYALDEARVHAALASGGAVFEELCTRFAEEAEALRAQAVQTLDVHFLRYAGLIAINSQPPGGRVRNLVTLELKGDEFSKLELNDDVRALMRHDHW